LVSSGHGFECDEAGPSEPAGFQPRKKKFDHRNVEWTKCEDTRSQLQRLLCQRAVAARHEVVVIVALTRASKHVCTSPTANCAIFLLALHSAAKPFAFTSSLCDAARLTCGAIPCAHDRAAKPLPAQAFGEPH
jgi:hypothetical protein